MAERICRKAVPLALAALLLLGGCDDEEEKPNELTLRVPEGTVIKVEHEKKDEMIVVGELALFGVFVVWALFGPGATRRRAMPLSEDR